MSKNNLSFGEELFLEEKSNLGEKDEVAILLCALCGLGTVAGCIACGCELPILFAGGSVIFAQMGAPAAVGGAAIPL